MGLLADLVQSVRLLPPYAVRDACAGRRFTAVAGSRPDATRLDAPADATRLDAPPETAGLAYTAQGEGDPAFDAAGRSRRLAGELAGRELQGLAGLVLPGRGSGAPDVGAAALNALLAAEVAGGASRRGAHALGEVNGLDLVLERSAGKRLAMVGRFPYLDRARLTARDFAVLELHPQEGDLPAEAAPEVLPRADVVGITGSTLANGTLEGLLALCRRDALVVLIGPTTPLSPLLFDHGADVLCGALVEQPRVTLGALADASLKPSPRIPGTRMISLSRPGLDL